MIYNFENLTFQIFRIDKFRHNRGIYEVKARPFSALSFRTSGSGIFEIGNQTLVSNPGEILFVPSETPYKVEYSVSESIVVEMTECNYTEPENHSFENSGALELLFNRLVDSWSESHSVNRAKTTIYEILDKMENYKKSLVQSTEFSACLNYVESNFSNPNLDVKRMCELSFMSPSSLQRAFNRSFGLSPNKYLTKLRMNKALELLLENKMTVKEVAFACGFTDEKYFSRVFKERFGYPPSSILSSMMI